MQRRRASTNGGFAEVSTEFGRCILKAQVSDRQQRGMLFAPIHWNDENASSARVGALVGGVHRSVFGPAGSEGDAGGDCAACFMRSAASCCRAGR